MRLLGNDRTILKRDPSCAANVMLLYVDSSEAGREKFEVSASHLLERPSSRKHRMHPITCFYQLAPSFSIARFYELVLGLHLVHLTGLLHQQRHVPLPHV